VLFLGNGLSLCLSLGMVFPGGMIYVPVQGRCLAARQGRANAFCCSFVILFSHIPMEDYPLTLTRRVTGRHARAGIFTFVRVPAGGGG
jgi:hypothetical protein